MINVMLIDGHRAAILYDPEIEMFRGEFLGLAGGADFYAPDVAGLKSEGYKSLNIYLDMCKQNNIEPYKAYSGRFNLRLSPELHASAVATAMARGKSLNRFVAEAIAEMID